jgi:hypothetical protein
MDFNIDEDKDKSIDEISQIYDNSEPAIQAFAPSEV